MKLSTKVRYGMRAIVEIATTAKTEPLSISQIAESQDVSKKYLESLLVQLKKQGILQSLRGQKGGYMLNKDPQDITVYEITEALDGPVTLVHCGTDGEKCNRKNSCSTVHLWNHLTENLIGEMKNITLSDLINNIF
jgi:Rrf2 family transcriptional regulator, cysteine metabolism repressor